MFEIGQTVTNEELRQRFKCGNMGGMRRSLATNTLVIVADHTKGLYDDKWVNDVLHYTGMGKSGDQSLTFNQNKTLAESGQNGVDVHLFEVLVPGQYIYRGIAHLADEPYQERQIGEDGRNRQVWMFPLALADGPQAIMEDELEQFVDERVREIQRLPLEELRRRAKVNGSDTVSSRSVTSNTHVRDVYVSEYAKRRADGICQLCEEPAPFSNREGSPYLESHHIEWIANGGSDTIENTVALCPNCHRKMHILDLEEDKVILRSKACL